ncbi:NAD-dependent epimerase/dehydratase family protein [Flavobacteriales bacterium]|nr:NAD-dependent epimerase/dehydratase family protein [Flavobacteriales bacterium]
MILVIGGSGFVGSSLLSRLNLTEFKNLDKNPSPFFVDNTIIHDIRDVSNLDIYFKGVNQVVLLAAEHRDDVSPTSLYYDVNEKGTQNVLDAMDKHNVKNLIFTSSVAVYGLNKNNPNENNKIDPFNHYGKSKWGAEQAINNWYVKNPINKSITILRPTVIFGKRNRGNVYNLLKQISLGRFLMIGKGENKKSMAYVGNITALIQSRLKTNEEGYHVLNYADKPDYSMKELTQLVENKMKIKSPSIKIPYILGLIGGFTFDLIAFITNKKLSISSVRVKKFCATTQFDASKAHNSFQAPFSIEEGLNKTLEHEFINKKEDDVLFYTE